MCMKHIHISIDVIIRSKFQSGNVLINNMMFRSYIDTKKRNRSI